MEFVSGQTKKDVVEISDILTGDYEGRDISMNGAIHTIRDMGEVAFVILRKREGLVQTVFETGAVDLPRKKLKEAAAENQMASATASRQVLDEIMKKK